MSPPWLPGTATCMSEPTTDSCASPNPALFPSEELPMSEQISPQRRRERRGSVPGSARFQRAWVSNTPHARYVRSQEDAKENPCQLAKNRSVFICVHLWLRSCFWLGCALVLLLAENARGDAGVLIPSNRPQPDPSILSLDEMAIDIVIDNGDARVQVRQIFGSHTGEVLEGNYIF